MVVFSFHFLWILKISTRAETDFPFSPPLVWAAVLDILLLLGPWSSDWGSSLHGLSLGRAFSRGCPVAAKASVLLEITVTQLPWGVKCSPMKSIPFTELGAFGGNGSLSVPWEYEMFKSLDVLKYRIPILFNNLGMFYLPRVMKAKGSCFLNNPGSCINHWYLKGKE